MAAMDDGWKQTFFNIMGQTPESLGIHDYDTADKAIRLTQSLRNVQAPPMQQNYSSASGYGTRNESIYPTR